MSGSQLLLLGGTPQVVSDPNFEYTTLLLPGNGTNGAQNNTFLDSSTNNFTITRNGNTTQGTFSPFSQTGWGNYFDGSGDSLSLASNAAFAPGTGDFTFEAWINPTTLSAAVVPVFIVSTAGGLWIGKNGSNFVVRAFGVADQLQVATLPSTNQWTHIAVTRSGTTLRMFYNGLLVGSTTNSYNFTQGNLYIGSDGGSDYYTGYISNLRLVKGTAVYTADFTPPTTPLTAISGTSLLTCQSNRFIDNSTNNFTITRNGDVSVQAFSPFNPTAAWSAATNGGSGYFDGSGDYLTAPDNAASEIGASNFCVEGWFYPTVSSASYQTVFCKNQAGISGGFGPIYITFLSGVLRAYSGSTTAWNVLSNVTIGTPQLNAWNHFVVCRSGANWGLYLNGTRNNTASSTATLLNNTANYGIGAQPDGAETTTGYLSGIRLVIGSSVYDPTQSTLTVPTAPLTAITNTSLLLNFTNAGIYDATSKNDLETVGNAQISTTQSKFGGSSISIIGSSSNRVKPPASQNFAFGTGNFTVEAWIYITNLTTENFVFDTRSSASTAGMGFSIEPNTGKLRYSGSANNVLTSSAVSANTWTHVAWVRSGGTLTGYINGTAGGSASNSDNLTQTNGEIGNVPFSGVTTNMYMNDLRITKGVARYTANFTAPTAAFPLL